MHLVYVPFPQLPQFWSGLTKTVKLAGGVGVAVGSGIGVGVGTAVGVNTGLGTAVGGLVIETVPVSVPP